MGHLPFLLPIQIGQALSYRLKRPQFRRADRKLTLCSPEQPGLHNLYPIHCKKLTPGCRQRPDRTFSTATEQRGSQGLRRACNGAIEGRSCAMWLKPPIFVLLSAGSNLPSEKAPQCFETSTEERDSQLSTDCLMQMGERVEVPVPSLSCLRLDTATPVDKALSFLQGMLKVSIYGMLHQG